MGLTHKTIVVLLIVSIIFSAISMMVAFSLSDFSFEQPRRSVQQENPQPGNVNFYVEEGSGVPSG